MKTYNHRLWYPVYLMALWLFNICIKGREGEQRFRVERLYQHVPQRLRFYEINCGMEKAFKTRFRKIIIRLGERPSLGWRWWKYFLAFFSANVWNLFWQAFICLASKLSVEILQAFWKVSSYFWNFKAFHPNSKFLSYHHTIDAFEVERF